MPNSIINYFAIAKIISEKTRENKRKNEKNRDTIFLVKNFGK